ncbi:TolC family protein [Aestuariibacter sp. A3R04]|uniref:TolC family protein n=1 Tax=Aestuariibacter sp. A3R04 TaxID=2841571 RepID=UPI001C097BAE|nr:TolC family protein [Aestuariibacter sp. A3R04]MBU3021388.1 TolC family protein [Aestuariibacter sp. A3R04]
MSNAKQIACAVAASLLLSACASVDDKTLSESATDITGKQVVWQPLVSEYSGQNVPAGGALAASQLTDLIDVTAVEHLSSYINEALNSNPSLQQTLITLRQAQVSIDSAESQGAMNLDASFNGGRDEQTGSSFSSALSVSWELDLWQKIADGVTAANLDAASARASYQAAKDSLIASVIRSYVEIITQQNLLSIERERLQVLENQEAIILTRYRTGLGGLDDLDSARTSSANTRATIAQYEYAVAAAKRTLAVLLGRQEQSLTELTANQSYPDVLLPLTALPEQDLARRPDLQAAYFNIKASEYEVDVAYKALLPSINLSAALTDSASSASQALFANPLWSVLGQITAPLFQGGQLRAQIESAELSALNAWWQYKETLLNAVQETQDAIDNERALTARIQFTTDAIENAQRSVTSTSGNYRQGLADILDLLSVYNTHFDLQAQQVQLRSSQLQNRIDLGLALGLGVSQ